MNRLQQSTGVARALTQSSSSELESMQVAVSPARISSSHAHHHHQHRDSSPSAPAHAISSTTALPYMYLRSTHVVPLSSSDPLSSVEAETAEEETRIMQMTRSSLQRIGALMVDPAAGDPTISRYTNAMKSASLSLYSFIVVWSVHPANPVGLTPCFANAERSTTKQAGSGSFAGDDAGAKKTKMARFLPTPCSCSSQSCFTAPSLQET